MKPHLAFALLDTEIAVHYITRGEDVVIMEASFRGIRIPLERFTENEMTDMHRACVEAETSRGACLREP